MIFLVCHEILFILFSSIIDQSYSADDNHRDQYQLLVRLLFLVSCTFASPFYYHYGVSDGDYRQCVLLTDENLQKHFRVYTVTLYYFIPLTIILICYTRLLYYVHQKEKKVKSKSVSSRLLLGVVSMD